MLPTPERIQKQKDLFLSFGIRSFRSWQKTVRDIYIDGYLIEPVIERANTHSLVVLSCIGRKRILEEFYKELIHNKFALSKPGYSGFSEQHMYLLAPFATQTDMKGLLAKEITHIHGTSEYRMIIYRKDLIQVKTDQEYLEAYLVGVDANDVEQGFPRLLGESTIPYLDEWLTPIKSAIRSQPKWVTELIGHQMQGLKVKIPKEGILAMVQQMVKDGTLTAS